MAHQSTRSPSGCREPGVHLDPTLLMVAALAEMKSNTKSCSYFAQRGERPPEFQAAPSPWPIAGTANLMCPPWTTRDGNVNCALQELEELLKVRFGANRGGSASEAELRRFEPGSNSWDIAWLVAGHGPGTSARRGHNPAKR